MNHDGQSSSTSVGCAVCGSKPNPLIYQPGVKVRGGNFGKCSRCGKVFCNDCTKKEWIGTIAWVNKCPNDDVALDNDIFS